MNPIPSLNFPVSLSPSLSPPFIELQGVLSLKKTFPQQW